MYDVPSNPKVYHITHLSNIPEIIQAGGLYSHAAMNRSAVPTSTIGLDEIKNRRLRLPVHCNPGDHVGDYVPFYFCPRSIMLYILYKASHENLTYRGGQGPIVHLEADLNDVLFWAEMEGKRWAFSTSNAGAYYAEFHNTREDLGEVDWGSVFSNDFREDKVRQSKQAELLVHEFFSWHLVRRIGVYSESQRIALNPLLNGAEHKPFVDVRPDWYF